MRTLQRIDHEGRPAAVVIAGQAIIDDTLSEGAFAHVQAKCLYALELAAGGRADSYSEADAETYARNLLGNG